MPIPESNKVYNTQEYWNDRFTTEDHYEWCKDYSHFKNLIVPIVNKKDRILILG